MNGTECSEKNNKCPSDIFFKNATSSAVREMQFKTTLTIYLVPVGLATVN